VSIDGVLGSCDVGLSGWEELGLMEDAGGLEGFSEEGGGEEEEEEPGVFGRRRRRSDL